MLDLETTGTAPEVDRIVEIAILKLHPSGREAQYRRRVNPEMPIPPEATRVHGIGDREVRGLPTFRQLAPEIARRLQGCDLAGFNIGRFDLPFLQREFERAGVRFPMKGRRVIDAYRIFVIKEPRDLRAALRFYCARDHSRAHSALDDVRATWQVLQAQLRRYPDLPRSVAALEAWFNSHENNYVDSGGRFEWRYQRPAFAFGKHRGRLLQQVAQEDPDYLHWLLTQGLPKDTQRIVRKAMARFPLPST